MSEPDPDEPKCDECGGPLSLMVGPIFWDGPDGKLRTFAPAVRGPLMAARPSTNAVAATTADD